jgi:hypothetical protein
MAKAYEAKDKEARQDVERRRFASHQKVRQFMELLLNKSYRV